MAPRFSGSLVPASLLALCAVAIPLLFAGCSADADRADSLRALARWEDRRAADPDSLDALMYGPDAHLRRAAMRAAGLIGRSEALPGLLDGLEDRSDAVREAAATALGRLGDPAAVPSLIDAMAEGHAGVRLAVLESLARLPHDGQALIEPALHESEREAAAAWNALRDRADDIDPQLLGATIRSGLVRADTEVIWRVLRCAERSADSTLAADIAPFAKHRNVQVRVHACRALGRLGGATALRTILEFGEDRALQRRPARIRDRIAAAGALGRLAGPAFAAAPDDAGPGSIAGRCGSLLAALSHDPDTGVSRTALRAIAAAVGDLPAVPESARRESLLPVWRIQLLRAVRDLLPARMDPAAGGGEPGPRSDIPPAHVRAEAAAALCALRGSGACHDAAWPVLSADRSLPVRAALWRGLGAHCLSPRQLVARIGTLHPGTPPEVHAAALTGIAAALRRFRSSDLPPAEIVRARNAAERALVTASANTDFTVVANAAGLLGEIRGTASLIALCRAWEEACGPGAVDVHIAVLESLKTFFSPPQGQTVPQIGPDLQRRIVACLESGFDSPRLRLRLAARRTALDGNLLPDRLVPSEASLRATLPAHVRSPEQPPLALPFDAPRLRCETRRGTLVIALDGRAAPNAAATVLALAEDGYYDEGVFHRVVPDFVVQGGDPRGDGWGGPGFTIRSEWSRIPYERGAVGIAHSGKDTGGSQFFITLSPQPHLNGRYTVIGKVVSGMDVADAVQPGDTFRMVPESE